MDNMFEKYEGDLCLIDYILNSSEKKNDTVTAESVYKRAIALFKPKIRKNKIHPLKLFLIWDEDREFVTSNQMPELLRNGPSINNYKSYFRTLVILEELALEEGTMKNGMKLVRMKETGVHFMCLNVPGLTKRKPPLRPGDTICAELATQEVHGKCFIHQGCILLVAANSIILKFSSEFHCLHSDENLYNIGFTGNRINFRRFYQAIEAAGEALGANVLFPSSSGERRRIQLTKTAAAAPISEALNEEQWRAIDYILRCSGGAPYVIYGPPGTGKTKTLVELILQLYKTKPNSRILVCTSSNCVADHILKLIVSADVEVIKEDEIHRLNAKSRCVVDIDQDLVKYCTVQGLRFICSPLTKLQRYRIVVSTYSSAHLLYETGIDRGYYSNIIMDEAGQATEPETMIPIANLAGLNTTVVLAGDPKQLGPLVLSREAGRYGLGKSFMERLCESEVFYREGDPNYVTMLVRNYRCHPEILSLPSKMFYNDKLIAAKGDGDLPIPWADMLLNRDFPVIFYGVEGQNMKEWSNPSWFNQFEVEIVMRVVRILVGFRVKEQDIGVIAPYSQQVTKIKHGLEGQHLSGIKVGSVEQFQGQEREVIIVSTVRSTVKHDGEVDELGFLASPKRFNVVVTRARSLLVIVGNPHTISEDPCWGRLLWHCVDNGSFQGCGVPERRKSIDSMPADNGSFQPVNDNTL